MPVNVKTTSALMTGNNNGGNSGPLLLSHSSASPLLNRSLLVIILSVAFLTSLLSTFMMAFMPTAHTLLTMQKMNDSESSVNLHPSNVFDVITPPHSEPVAAADNGVAELRADLERWLVYLRGDEGDGVRTARVGCRELEARAQTCVFEGIACVNVSSGASLSRSSVIFVDDAETDGATVSSDNWCRLRHISADPRYFSSRHWPFLTDTVAPQRSCLDAQYRTSSSLFTSAPGASEGESENGDNNTDPTDDESASVLFPEVRPSVNLSRVKWVPSMSLIDLDYADNSHNNHLVKDILWLLDIDLFQDSLVTQPRPGYPTDRTSPREPEQPGDAQDQNSDALADTNNKNINEHLLTFRRSKYVYLPQSREQFIKQTSRDVNRLTYSIILRKNARKLYPTLTDDDLHTTQTEKRATIPLLEAFPELAPSNSTGVDEDGGNMADESSNGDENDGELLFHQDLVTGDNDTDLVCTPRMMVGAKIGNGAHERVCREIRTRAYELYGIERPSVVGKGQIKFPQPPKSVLVLDRHVTRRIGNAEQLVTSLRDRFEPLGFSVVYMTTVNISTAEEFVRVYSSAGVIITPHGSHNMGQLFMHRYSALVEIMPVGYTDYAFNLLSESCRIWYYELQSSVPQDMMEYYQEKCGRFVPHMLNPCNEVKSKDVWVNVSKIVDIVTLAAERLGYETDTWLSDIHERTR